MSVTYQDTLDYLFSQLPMFQRTGVVNYKIDLSNIRAMSARLGDPHRRFPSVHIAGTNGKGSTAHMISAVLQAAGYRTGLYTSPHYRDFRERIKIDGAYVEEDFVVEFVERCRPIVADLRPSFFELTVAMAFEYFADRAVDVAVIETGLGGRLDSTNIITPLLSVITNISYDHQQFLGDTLPEIAGEKAGIIKPGVPVVIGETQEATRAVFEEKAASCGAPLTFADQHYRLLVRQAEIGGMTADVDRNGVRWFDGLQVEAYGDYQRKNIQTVLQALELLQPHFPGITEPAIRKGLGAIRSLTRFIGRWQQLGDDPRVLCDSAHNEAGLEEAVRQLRTLPCRQLRIVMGMVKDKDRSRIMQLLPGEAQYYFAKPDIPRGLDAGILEQEALDLGLHGRAYPSVAEALAAARREAAPDDLIFVGGSVFVVAEVV